MPAIRDASAGGPMPGGTRLRNDGILPIQLKREEIPVNFLLFTGSLDFALASVAIANERGDRLLRVRFDSTVGCRRSNGQPFLPFCANEPKCANEANGKTVVKTMFEYERSQPGECLAAGARQRAMQESILAERTQGTIPRVVPAPDEYAAGPAIYGPRGRCSQQSSVRPLAQPVLGRRIAPIRVLAPPE